MHRCLTAILLLAAAFTAAAQMRWVRLDTLTAAEMPAGVWRQMPAGAIFEVAPIAGRQGEYTMSLLTSDDLTILPGTHFGTMRATAEPGIYDAELFLDPKNAGTQRNNRKKRRFTISVDLHAARMHFKEYKSRFTVSLWRLFPYLFRFSVKYEDTRPEGLDGAVRIAPESYSETTVL